MGGTHWRNRLLFKKTVRNCVEGGRKEESWIWEEAGIDMIKKHCKKSQRISKNKS